MQPSHSIMDCSLAVATIRDWADLIRAVAWPLVAVFALLKFRGILESLLARIIHAEGMGFKITLEKLLPKAEKEARQLKLQIPDPPTPDTDPQGRT